MWHLQVPALQELGPVWAPDLPGFGGAAPLAPEHRTPARYADWVADRMRREGLVPARVAGYSMGGTIALLLALRHPELVESLALCCTSARWGNGGRAFAGAAFAACGRPAMELVAWSVLAAVRRHSRDPGLHRVAREMARLAHRPTMTSLYRRLAVLDLSGDLGAVRAPALAVAGGRDWLATPDHARALARGMRGARLRIVGPGDHLLCLSHAELFSSILVDFWNSLPGGRRAAAE